MVKRLVALAGGAALLLGVAVPALACEGGPSCWLWFSKDVAIVDNGAVAVSNTGGNSQTSYASAKGKGNKSEVDSDGARYMQTGAASSYAGALVVANVHTGCGCLQDLFFHKDYADVDNDAVAGASTGGNAQDDVALTEGSGNHSDVDADGARTMYTGPASSTARAWTLTNIHWGGSMVPSLPLP